MIRSNRIFSIVELIDKNNEILLDIGTDHGYIIKEAFKQKKTKEAIASDINEMPLASAKENLKDYPVKFALSNGFKKIEDKYNTAVIAGLGSNLITEILEDASDDKNITYILQGNNKVERLRKYLMENNFKIIDEILVFENDIYYVIIKAIRGKMNLTEQEIYLGPILMKDNMHRIYYKSILDHYIKEGNKNSIILEVYSKEIAMLKHQLS